MNLFDDLQPDPAGERTTTLLEHAGLKIERIVSLGQSSPPDFWYEQEMHEWVTVLSGRGAVAFEDGRTVLLTPGDTLFIPAGQRHRVAFTDPKEPTVWLAIHFP